MDQVDASMAALYRADLDTILEDHGVSIDDSSWAYGGLASALLGWATTIAVEVAKEQYEIAASIPQGFNTTKSFDTVYLWCTRCPGGTNGHEPLDLMAIGDPDGLSRWFKTMREHDIPHRLAAAQAALDGGSQ